MSPSGPRATGCCCSKDARAGPKVVLAGTRDLFLDQLADFQTQRLGQNCYCSLAALRQVLPEEVYCPFFNYVNRGQIVEPLVISSKKILAIGHNVMRTN
jgi:hypothetical protein